MAQLSREGTRVNVKTDASSSVVPLTRDVVVLLKEHKLRSGHTRPDDFVFATATGTPISQRNLLRELDRAQRAAVDERGNRIFPTALDEHGKRVPRAKAGLPTIHGMRHTLRRGSWTKA